MSLADVPRHGSGLSELIGALASARTTAEVADVIWWRRAEACGAMLAGLAVRDPEPRLLTGHGPGGGPPVPVDPLLLVEFACTRVPLFFDSAQALLERYPVLRSIGTAVPGQACAALPLTGPGTPAGALVLAWDRPRGFSVGDRALLTALAGLCSTELARTGPADRERDALERLRRRLAPPELPAIDGAELAVRHRSAAGVERGIPYHDVIGLRDGMWRLVAGNVTGVGVDAAVLVGLARQAFRSAGPGAGPAAALGRLHRLAGDFGDPRQRVSAVCVDLRRRDSGFAVTCARIGHAPALVLRDSGAVLPLDVPGGGDDEPVELGLELGPGDGVLLCAAGPSQGGPTGDPRLTAVLAGCAGRSAEALLDRIDVAVADGDGPPTDGATFLALRVRGGRTRSPARGRPPGGPA